MRHLQSITSLGAALLLCGLTGCSSTLDPRNGDATSRPATITITGLSHPVPTELVFEVVINNRKRLGTFMCPDERLLLGVEPQDALSPSHSEELRRALESDGCKIVDDTPDARDSFLNPATDEWRLEKYKGAFIAYILVRKHREQRAEILAIETGWYKGHLHSKSESTLFRWNGSAWIPLTVGVISVS